MNPFPPGEVLKVAILAHGDERHLEHVTRPFLGFAFWAIDPAAAASFEGRPKG
jgi:hypothetical protein